MLDTVERGSGSLVSTSVFMGIAALTFGLLSGVSVIRHAVGALRAAENAAIDLATFAVEGEVNPCSRSRPPMTECSVAGDTVTVRVSVRGFRASATAGPDPRD